MELIQNINSFLWNDNVLYVVLAAGVLFTTWSGFCQYRALTHGLPVTLGRYDNPSDPGAINHFQALSTAMSSTVGLGNIGGVAIAISLGGPGALFWMWVVGVFGMALKVIEVTLAMMYRNLDDPTNPRGGPMWVSKHAFAELGLPRLGLLIGSLYCLATIIGSFTGGNMFQAWNVADVTHTFFGWPRLLVGAILSITVGLVIIGGIKRIGKVTSIIVPVMCVMYLLAGAYVLVLNIASLPSIFSMIIASAFNPTQASGAFVGGTMGSAMLWGMKRALYSSEAGLGSSAIAHSAAKTNEPVREGIVAGLEPFIDTLVVCTITGLIILSSGVWNQSADGLINELPEFEEISTTQWQLPPVPIANFSSEQNITPVFIAVTIDDGELIRVHGEIVSDAEGHRALFNNVTSLHPPSFRDNGVFKSYNGATLTAHAFNQTHDWLGIYLVTIAAWFFAISTIIAQGYYGEQAVYFLFKGKGIFSFKLTYCFATFVATFGFITTDRQLDAVTTTGTGLVLISGLSITLLFGYKAIKEYHRYIQRLSAGEFDNSEPQE